MTDKTKSKTAGERGDSAELLNKRELKTQSGISCGGVLMGDPSPAISGF